MNNKASTDKLVRSLRDNNITAFNQLFEYYSSKLYHFAFGYLKSFEDTEELVQEVFIKIWEKRKDINPDYDFQSYLFTIAFNQVKKHFRSKHIMNKYLEHAGNFESNSVATPEVDYRELSEIIDRLVDRMPEKRKQVFIKSRIEGKNILEISEEMDISKKTAENHLHTALKYLKQELGRENLIGMLFFYLYFF